MKYRDVLRMFTDNLNSSYLDVLISKKTAQILLDNGFAVTKLGAYNYGVHRRLN